MNQTTVETAMKYADKLLSTSTFQHSYTKGLGENLAMIGSTFMPTCETLGSNFVKMWYDEIKDYDFTNPGFSSGLTYWFLFIFKI